MIHKMKSNEESFERVNTDKLKENLEKFVPYNEQEETDKRIMLKYLKDFDIVGADIVELAPDYDKSEVSTAVVTKIVRDVLMIL